MSLLLEVIRELFGMFWADAGLCLGALATVLVVGIAWHFGWVGEPAALAVLVGGIVATLLVNVWIARGAHQSPPK